MKVDTYNIKGEKTGTTDLPERLFGVKWNQVLVKQVFDAEGKNSRRPWAHAKGRGEVRGGGRKPWRQKHLGRARHGSIRSPIWIGGGVAHGPIKERDYSVKINKKMKRWALLSLLSKKLKESELVFLDSVSMKNAKTKEMFNVFKNLRESAKIYHLGIKGGKVLLALPREENVMRSSRNLPFVFYSEPRNLNVVALLGSKYVVMDKSSVEELESVFKN